MKKIHYEKLVRDKVKEEAFQYLKNKIKSKGSFIDYGKQLEMQAYLKPNRVLTFQEQIDIFSYRSEMNELSLKYLQENDICACTKELNNIHLFECTLLNNKKGHELKYEDILNRTFHQQKNILNILKNNLATYRKITLAA